MLTVNSEVKKIYGKTEGAIHSKTGVSPIEFNANNQGLISWSMLGNGEQASSQTYSLTEQPPISFNADGNPLASWSMLGNGQQSGTPTPDAPIMPDFCGVRTAQLFDATNADVKQIFPANTGNFSTSSNARTACIACKPNETYTFSKTLSERFIVCYTTEQPANGVSYYGQIEGNAQTEITITTGADAVYLAVFYYNSAYDTKTEQEIRNSIMLNLGSTALPYEPYGWSEKITCAGQTVPVYLGQTQTVRKIRKLVLTGAELGPSGVWRSAWWTSAYVLIIEKSELFAVTGYGICTHYTHNTAYPVKSGNFRIVTLEDAGGYTTKIGFSSSGFANLDAFKAFLAAQYAAGTPVTVWYVLATPETAIVNEPLAKIGDYADELHSADTTVTIPTQNGSNTLTIGSTLQPSSMTITTASSVYPKNPIMPEFCGERTGNLCGMPHVSFTIQSTFSVISTGDTITFSGTAGEITSGNAVWKQLDFWLDSGDYILSLGAPRGYQSGYAAYLLVYDTGTRLATISGGSMSSSTFTLAERTHIYIAYYIYSKTLTNDKWVFMLNTGSTALPYEPYGYKIPVTNAGTTTNIYALEPLRKIGDYADVVGSNGAVTRRIKKLVLTGTENTWSATYWVHAFVLYGAPSETRPQGISNYAICPHFVQASTTNLSAGQFNVDYNESSGIMRFGFNYTGFADITEFKAWLATQYANGNPVTVWYVLATPTTEQITAPTIPTQNGANTVSVDTPVPPSSLTIQYTSPDISEIVRAVDGQGKPLYGPRYGFKIDKSQTDSASAIIYTHDAVTMTPAYMDYANGSFNYGSWGNAWFVKEAKPVALNLDGTIAYYLDPDDYTKKLDGTNSDIFYTLLSVEPSDWSTQWKQYYHLNNGEYVLNDDAEAPTFAANTYYKLDTSFTGNFMVQFPKVYFKRYEDENYNYVEVSDRKLSRDFKAYAHLNANGDEVDFIYLPMFKGVIQSSKLRSIPGVIPQGGTTASEEVTAAEACGTGWQIWDHSSREMINDLLVLMSKNADSQAKFGKGRESGYDASDTATYGKLQTGTLIKKGAFYGYNTSYSDIKVFHIEGPWANRWERLQGLLLVDGVYKIKMAPPYNFTGTDFVTLTTASPTSNNYVRTLATSEYGSVPATVSAFASSPFKDYFYQSQSGTRVGVVGGYCNGGSACGRRCVALIYTALSSNWVIGASAIYK